MTRALGVNAQTLLAFETTYGTAATGNYNKVPFVSIDYNPDQKLIEDDTIGHGREMLDPSRDVINVNHAFEVPVDVNNIGYWLEGLFGTATDSGSTHVTHTWESGGVLPSLSIEVGMNDLTRFFMKLGAKIGSMTFDFQPSGLVTAKGNLIAQADVPSGSSGGGTPTVATYQRFNQFQGAITLGGSAIAGITSAELTLDNKLEVARVIRNDGLIEGADELMASVSGKLTARFEDESLYNDAAGGTPVALTMGWTIDSNTSLIFTVPRVFLPQSKGTVKGPGGISTSFDFQASKDATAGCALEAVLKNAVATYNPS